MIRILPQQEFLLVSPHPVPVLIEKLRAVTIPDRPLFGSGPSVWFYGDIDHMGFELTRNNPGRNSFEPRIFGEWGKDGSGSYIRVTQKLSRSVAIGMSIWLAFSSLVSATMLVMVGMVLFFHFSMGEPEPSSEYILSPAAGIPIAFLLAPGGWAMMNILFWIPARPTKTELMRALEAVEEMEPK